MRLVVLLFALLLTAEWSLAQSDIHFTVPINLKFPDNESVSLGIADSDSIYHDQCILKLPPNYQHGTPVRLVYMAHGAGGGVKEKGWYLNQFSLKDSLLANGYAIFDVNGGPLVENMGGSWAVQAAYKAYEYIRKNYSVYPQLFVSGFSMGGLSSTNFVYKHSNLVLAHALYSPVLDLYSQAWENPWLKTTRSAIATTHNFSDVSGKKWENEKVTGWNPLMINTFLNGKDTVKIYPVPVKIWHGTDDKVVRISASRKFHKYIRNAGGYSELREIKSDDHGLSCGTSSMNRELILFFKRFDN
jgi:predicted esterase